MKDVKYHQKTMKVSPFADMQLNVINALLHHFKHPTVTSIVDAVSYAKQNLPLKKESIEPSDYFLHHFLRKLALKGDDSLCEKAALDSLTQGEAHCKNVNALHLKSKAYNKCIDVLLDPVAIEMRKLLGDFDAFWRHCRILLDEGNFPMPKRASTGFTYQQVEGKPWARFGARLTISSELKRYLDGNMPAWRVFFPYGTTLCGATELAFVPKDGSTHRTIEKQHDVNMIFQLILGQWIRRRLKDLYGLDLNDATRNQQAALAGSITRYYATIDLKNASNTISHGLVWSVLRYAQPFLGLMEALRSTHSVYQTAHHTGQIHYEMFSAMGNGFTFELESAIFFFIARQVSVRKSYVSTYGDDIVCHTRDFKRVCDALIGVGFMVNDTKSFYGKCYLRESCGKHYIKGLDITPAFMRGVWTGPNDVYAFANSIGDSYEDLYGLRTLVYNVINGFVAEHGKNNPWLKLFYGPRLEERRDGMLDCWLITSDVSKYKTRYNRKLQRVDIAGHSFMAQAIKLSSKEQFQKYLYAKFKLIALIPGETLPIKDEYVVKRTRVSWYSPSFYY